jgi:hypothetical protein
MAKEAERLLEGTGWLPEPARLIETDAEARQSEALPPFLAEPIPAEVAEYVFREPINFEPGPCAGLFSLENTITQAFDFRGSVAYDDDRKREFHHVARRQLRLLAKAPIYRSASYDLRSNKAGIAVSWEITLDAEHL